jgi:anti-sigma regulatory factor (Ser/Thr protein kinase)
VAEARRFAFLSADWLSAESRDRLALLVSEVATNSIKHARNGFTLAIERVEDAIRVEVSDRGPGFPVVLELAPDVPHGHGMRLVQALSDDWGVVAEPWGKTVWFVLG